MSELCRQTATRIVTLLRRGEVSAGELVEAAIERIELVDGQINALPIRCFERARESARRLDAARDTENPRSLLGLPIAVKDYNDVAGVRTTYGSPIFAGHVPERSDATVARLERNGANPIAKSNVPEWAGGHTFNPVFGITPTQIFEAQRTRQTLYQRMIRFFEHHDLLICPAASIAPFPVEQRYVEEIDGQACETYIDWFSITFALTMTSCPVLSVPCGFTTNGLPVGIQLLGRPRGEAALLRAAHRLEGLLGMAPRLPIDPRGSGSVP